jgi:hypothetical protein
LPIFDDDPFADHYVKYNKLAETRVKHPRFGLPVIYPYFENINPI